MEEALVTDDETESLGVEKREGILEYDQRGEKGWNGSMTSWSNRLAQWSGGSQKKRIENLLDCKRL